MVADRPPRQRQRPRTITVAEPLEGETWVFRRHLPVVDHDDRDRPRSRGGCAPCETCQVHHDAAMLLPDAQYEAIRPDEVLACGHMAGDAHNRSRPCPWLGCEHHVCLDVSRSTGAVKVNHEVEDMGSCAYTCSLDVADSGGVTLEEVGEIMNLTRERVRQIEQSALSRLRHRAPDLAAYLDLESD